MQPVSWGRRWWQSHRLVLSPGVGMALGEASALLDMWGYVLGWVYLSVICSPLSFLGTELDLGEPWGMGGGARSYPEMCVWGRRGVLLSFSVIADPSPEEAGTHMLCSLTSLSPLP